MSGVKSYSTTAASNTNANTGVNFDENQAPSTVNDSARQLMADVRSFYETTEWRDWGHTPTRTGNTTFTVPTNQTSVYTANRPIRCTDSSTLYGYVVSSAFSSVTTVTVALDSGNLSSSLTAVALGPDPTTLSIPGAAIRIDNAALNEAQGSDIASASTINLDTATGNLVDVTGTTTITAITLSKGRQRVVRFTGILTLTNGASLVLPGGGNITTAAGDFAIFRGYASGVVRCVGYFSGATPLIAATQAQMEAASSSAAVVTPAVQHFHPSAAKAWGTCGVTGNLASPSYNMSSVTDTGTGQATFNFSTSFSSSVYAVVSATLATNAVVPRVNTRNTGSVFVESISTATDVPVDPTGGHSVICFGDFA